ncbi:N-acyl-L-amino-acid [Conidiobolus coronatus NRRL 28638]|uniref:N-acyl-L-amino-acid n=1 Tax=Conidiobolus coronatus (strain ATCC 28846 / CBS 209.66 / NRRL 28638) TaxID=796925 RepID=A0A137P6I0_CONC2|nr:N-acyl-L-amino-acid [Conidiobolus coronatus NRRL 28638]|eukprot:KXN70569.1 N-acyl-L-amino-acid [Conidiobolus coronatus NRRL 28638]
MKNLPYFIYLLSLGALNAQSNPNSDLVNANKNITESVLVQKLQEYVRIKTVHPTPDYEGSTKFLVNYSKELELPSKVIECVKGKPFVIMTWEGKDPKLPSIFLNSHSDVVPVTLSSWKWDPFSGEINKDEEGRPIIVGRGTQDVKGVGVCYLEAIRALKKSNFVPNRTIHAVFSPEEEMGGTDGMKCFVESQEFKNLNVGFSLDEGIVNPLDHYKVYYGERVGWPINVTATGNSGHGSNFIKNLAFEKFDKFYHRLEKFKKSEEKKLDEGRVDNIGEVSSINLTFLKVGEAVNTVPGTVNGYFDIRVSPKTNQNQLKSNLIKWANETNVSFFYPRGTPTHAITDYKNSIWWKAFTDSAKVQNVTLSPEIYVGGSDSKYLREKKIPALGVNPFKNHPKFAHDNNEYIRIDTLVEGYEFYKVLIPKLANAI